MSRYAASTKELDEAEKSWWDEHGDLEEDFCWVQTAREQQMLRRGYVAAIRAAIPADARVLESGCGAGWLTIELAKGHSARFVGADFSPSQIERARRAKAAAGLGANVDFEVVDASGAIAGDETFDAVVMHAFLHHLSTEEIGEVLDDAAGRLRPGGQLLLVEPVHHADGRQRGPLSLRVLRRLAQAPIALHHRGLRPQGEEERNARRRMDRRARAVAPFGPSPKEVPFDPGELEKLLDARFDVVTCTPVMSMSHIVAQEMLLAGLSQPRFWRAAAVPVLTAASMLDRAMLRSRPLPASVWVFQLYSCRRRP